jgi:hypothetical protein
LKFSVAFAGRKYSNRQVRHLLKGRFQISWGATGRRCEAAKVGRGSLVGAN